MAKKKIELPAEEENTLHTDMETPPARYPDPKTAPKR